ncbi:hypothetical protein [Nocardia noduli]|uniref:hypothetical protein n=1 Tax=Nocardia noduli TaxID=2815722 RepID=UPI001C23CED8|nr:hypothetical protein [Nocardia noduli]
MPLREPRVVPLREPRVVPLREPRVVPPREPRAVRRRAGASHAPNRAGRFTSEETNSFGQPRDR